MSSEGKDDALRMPAMCRPVALSLGRRLATGCGAAWKRMHKDQ
jgi:hypothetical protein